MPAHSPLALCCCPRPRPTPCVLLDTVCTGVPLRLGGAWHGKPTQAAAHRCVPASQMLVHMCLMF